MQNFLNDKRGKKMSNQNMIGAEIITALDKGDIEKASYLFASNNRSELEITPKEKWTWLHKILSGFEPDKPPRESVEYLLSKKIDVNAQDCYGMTALHYALRGRNAEAALLLLEAGADPNIPNQDNLIPLSMIGYMPERLDILEKMLKNGGNVHFFNGRETVIESYQPENDDEPEMLPIVALMEKYA